VIGTLLAFLMRRGRTGIALSCLGLLAFQCALTAFFTRTRPDQSMSQMMQMVPEFVRNFLGDKSLEMFSERGFLAVGFAHPLTLLLTGGLALANATRLAAEVEARTIDLLLSQPLTRTTLMGTFMVQGLIIALLTSASAFAGHRLGVLLFPLPEPVDLTPFLLVSANLGLLVLAMHALGLFAAAATNRRASAVGVAVSVLAVMLFLRLGAELWEGFALPARVSFFDHYVPARVVTELALRTGDVLALGCFTCLLDLAAWVTFVRRDLA
jgi:ABC-type transport system involved in multi-copper enzyme maturation permease subunit